MLSSAGTMVSQLLIISLITLLALAFVGAYGLPINIVDDPSTCTLAAGSTSTETAVAALLNETITLGSDSAVCTSSLQILTAVCSNDSSTTTTPSANSLIVQDCCSTACMAAVDKALVASAPACYRSFLAAVCNDTLPASNSSTREALFGLVQRCIGLNATCAALREPTGTLLPPELEARALNNSNTNNSNTTGGSSLSSEGNNSKTPPILDMALPDPFQLVPKTESGVVLATPEEIEQEAARRSVPQRRPLMLSRRPYKG